MLFVLEKWQTWYYLPGAKLGDTLNTKSLKLKLASAIAGLAKFIVTVIDER
jgi:hypothetical protein